MDALLLDLRFALRSLARHPGFALTAIVTLALGIGATTAIFSVVDAVILRPLPFERADRIVAIRNHWTKTGLRANSVSAPDFYDWKAQARSFQSMAYYTGGETSVTIGPAADYASVWRVTPGFFESLGAHAAIGRLLDEEEQKPGGPLAAILTDAFWRKQFNGNPAAIGLPLRYNDQVFTVTGVLLPDIRFPARADVYVPSWVRAETTSRSAHNYAVLARLGDGVTIDQARAEMDGISRRLAAAYPTSNDNKLTDVVTLQELLVGATRDTLYTLLAAVALVLLIACANVANLMLSRATSREREMVVRAAVGAARPRLVRQLLTESAVLGILSALSGAWLARLGMLGLIALAPENLPRLDEVRVDLTALAFAIGISLMASLLFGLAPALQAARVQLADGIRQGGKGSAIGARGGWARNAFVVAEIALAVVLVVGAGLLARSLATLAAVDMGFAPERLLVLKTAVPGVKNLAASTTIPTLIRSNGGYWIEGGPGPDQTGVRAPQALFTVVTPQYFQTLGVQLKRGRDFTDADTAGAPLVTIVSEALAKEAFQNQDPIGRRIQSGFDRLDFMTIVGVVGDLRTKGPAQPAQPEIYMPFEQHAPGATALTFVVRTEAADPLVLAETLRRKIAERNRDVPVKISTMEQTLETATAGARFQTFLLVVFAGVALLLALAGVYGVMAYTVSQRVPEIGVRIALGATPQNIRRLVFGDGARLGAAGLAIGLALALLSGRLLQGLLFGVTPRDPLILSAVVVAVAVATLLACSLPVRRAVRVDPMVALRAE